MQKPLHTCDGYVHITATALHVLYRSSTFSFFGRKGHDLRGIPSHGLPHGRAESRKVIEKGSCACVWQLWRPRNEPEDPLPQLIAQGDLCSPHGCLSLAFFYAVIISLGLLTRTVNVLRDTCLYRATHNNNNTVWDFAYSSGSCKCSSSGRAYSSRLWCRAIMRLALQTSGPSKI